MRAIKNPGVRSGAIMPFLVVTLVSLAALVALAVDLGMIMVARTQCQNAADLAAMVGARTLNGDTTTNNNYTQATANALASAEANSVLGQSIASNQVAVQIGSYSYDTTAQKFYTAIPKSGNDNNSLVQATVTYAGKTGFARVLGINGFNVTSTATAAHRPRDVALVLDYSGSMRFGSLPGLPFYGARNKSNNPESVYPTFGAYSAVTLQQSGATTDGSGNRFDPANITEADAADHYVPAIVNDFYASVAGSSPAPAFTAAPAGYAGTPGGDGAPHANFDSGTTWAKNVSDFVNGASKNTNFEAGGYDAQKIGGKPFSGYTQGPSYWGKTFFLWPPDPRSAKDWRQLFFINAATGGAVTQNGSLYDASGNWLAPGPNTYKINYQAILKWLQGNPAPFPAQLIAGRIQYYNSIPSGNDNTLNNRFWTQFPLSDKNERFWKDYIDYVLGVHQGSSNSWSVITQYSGYGDDFNWGTNKINTSFNPSTDAQKRYMDYTDNPQRPYLHFWFGPMTMVDFLGNYNLWYYQPPYCTQFNWIPGTAHETPLYACKLGIQAGLRDVQNNHPNDNLSLIMFSTPLDSTDTSGGGRFNRVRNPMNRDYTRMIDSLWFPQNTIDSPGTTLNPYDYANNLEVPRAMGGTCYSMGFMLAFNQFSSNSSLRTYNPGSPAGDAGGLGRKGAQRLVILETDGAPNTTADASLNNSGPYNSYYSVRFNSSSPGSSEFPSQVWGYGDNDSTVTSQIFQVVGQICALDSATPPGYSTVRKHVLVHCIGFGPVFEASSPNQRAALSTLQQIQYIGSVQSSPATPLADYKIITGNPTAMAANLQQALDYIMEDGVQVVLIK